MNGEALIAGFRHASGDKAEPYFWSDERVLELLSEAQIQACVRGRLLHEDARPEVCRITLAAGQASYPLHPKLYEITHLQIRPAVGSPRKLDLQTVEWLNAECPDWRNDPNPARFAIQRDTSLRIVGTFELGDVIELEAYRLPMKDLASESDKPEIHEAHHRHLIDWALHKAFSEPDAETIDPQRAKAAEQEFTRYFGPMPDSDLRRATRQDTQHHTQAWL